MEQPSAPKRMTACRRMLKDRITCPECGKEMTIRNLQYKHKRKHEKPPEKVQQMRWKATEAAIAAHARRMAKLRGEAA